MEFITVAKILILFMWSEGAAMIVTLEQVHS